MKRVKKIGSFAKKGIRHEREIWGINTMKDCNYTGFMSCLPRVLAYDLGVAFCRYIYMKHHQCNFTSVNDPLNVTVGYDVADSPLPRQIMFFVRRERTNVANTSSIDNYATFDTLNAPFPYTTKTVNDFAVWFRDNIILNPTNSFGANSVNVLSHYQFVYVDNDQISSTQPAVVMGRNKFSIMHPLERMYVQLYTRSNYCIQNQTIADGHGETNGDAAKSTERVDTNPIHGRMYFFKGLMPSLRQTAQGDDYPALIKGDMAMTDGNGASDGVIIPADAPTGAWRAPPRPDQFNNCYKTRYFTLKPGEIKKGTVFYKFKGTLKYFMDLVNNVAVHNLSSHPVVRVQKDSQKMGNCVLLAMEKIMRTGNSKNITIAWQLDRYSGAKIVSNKLQPMTRIYTQEPGGTDWANEAT